jgi:flagellar motility protein MotE (MotC chaperone)
VTVGKIYQSMSPEDAAAILDRLDDATAMSIFAGMRERQIAAILALMDHDRAVALTRALAGSS